jgi:HEAT repeat protein
MRRGASKPSAPAAGDENSIVAELLALKSQRTPRAARVAKALKIIEKTASPRVRNAAALALADLRAADAKGALVDLLARPETIGSRGTLLYALEQLGGDVPLPILAEIIAHESYEAREEALALIGRDRIKYSADEFARSKTKLETAAISADAERLSAIRRALKYLTINIKM